MSVQPGKYPNLNSYLLESTPAPLSTNAPQPQNEKDQKSRVASVVARAYPQPPSQLPTASAAPLSTNAPQAQSEKDQKSRVASVAATVYPQLPQKLPTASALSSNALQAQNEKDQKSRVASVAAKACPKLPLKSPTELKAEYKEIIASLMQDLFGEKDGKSLLSKNAPLSSRRILTPSQSATRPLTAATPLSATSAAAAPAQLVTRIPILSSFLDELFNRVSALIQQAEIACNELMIQAGRIIAINIENIKNAYKESLDYTIDKIDELLKDQLKIIQNMIENLERVTEDVLINFKRAATQLVLALPFSKDKTQLTSVSPYYVVYDSKEPKVTFEGIFNYAATPGFEATLTFGKTICEPPANSTQSLTFNVPVNTIVSDKAAALVEASTVRGTLSAPWDNGSWWWFIVWWWLSKKVDAMFGVDIVVLPPSPGKIAVEFTSKKPEIVKKPFATATFPIGFLQNAKIRIPIDPSWKIEQGSHKWVLLTGDPQYQYLSINQIESDNTIVLKIDQAFNMTFHVTFNKFEEVPGSQKPRVEHIDDLKWGSSKTVNRIKGEEIRVMFDAFDNTHNEFIEPFNYNRYLKITSTATQCLIEAKMPK